jgi:hypothetical protein
MAGLVPAIHVVPITDIPIADNRKLLTLKTWMPGTRPGMTELFDCATALTRA